MAQPPHQQQQQQQQQHPVPPWVRHLAATSFFGTCARHSYHPRSKCNFYCTVCSPALGQGLCQLCLQGHGASLGGCSGFPTQVYRYMYSDVIRVADFGHQIDLDGIQVYQANNHPAVHLRPWELSEGKSPSAYTKDCEGGCGRKLLSQWCYCSLECKIRALDGGPRSSRQALGPGSVFMVGGGGGGGGGMATAGAGPSAAAANPAFQLAQPHDSESWPPLPQLALPAPAAAAALQTGSLGSASAYSHLSVSQQALPPPTGAWAGSSAAGAPSIPGRAQPAVLALAAALAGAMTGSGPPQQPWQEQAPAPSPGGIISSLAQAQQHLPVQQLQQLQQMQQQPAQQQGWGAAAAIPALLLAAMERESRAAEVAAAAAGAGPAAAAAAEGVAQGSWQQQYRSSRYQALQQQDGPGAIHPPLHFDSRGSQLRGTLLASQDPPSSDLGRGGVSHASSAKHGQPRSELLGSNPAAGTAAAAGSPLDAEFPLPQLAEGGPGQQLAALAAVVAAAAGSPRHDGTSAAVPRYAEHLEVKDPPFQPPQLSPQQQQQQQQQQQPWPAGLGPNGSGPSSTSGATDGTSAAGAGPSAAGTAAPATLPTLAAPQAATLAALGSSKSLSREDSSQRQQAQQAQQAQQQGQPGARGKQPQLLASSSGLGPVTASLAEQGASAGPLLLGREDGPPDEGALAEDPASVNEPPALPGSASSGLEGATASDGPEPKRRRKLGSPRAAPAR